MLKFTKSLTEVLLIKQSHKELEYLRQDDQPNTHLMGFLHYRCLDSVTVLKAVYQHDLQMFTWLCEEESFFTQNDLIQVRPLTEILSYWKMKMTLIHDREFTIQSSSSLYMPTRVSKTHEETPCGAFKISWLSELKKFSSLYPEETFLRFTWSAFHFLWKGYKSNTTICERMKWLRPV